MPATELDSSARHLRQAAIKVLWRQWAALGVPVTGAESARALVDPEALVLASLALQGDERRLLRVLRLWIPSGARLLSVQRFRNLLPAFSQATQASAGDFAQMASAIAKDARWHSVTKGARTSRVEVPEPRRLASPVVDAPAALVLRLRLGLGVGVKPDLVAYLIGCLGGRATVQELAQALAYRSPPVRRAAEEMAAAGFIEAQPTAPLSWRIRSERWRPLLSLPDDIPVWRPWRLFFGFVDALSALAEEARSSGWSAYLQSSRARDLLEKQAKALSRRDLLFVDSGRYPGEELLVAIRTQAQQLATWAESVV